MAYTNLPPNLYDYFSTVNQRIRKLESAPDQAMTTATSAQSTANTASAQALEAATAAGIAQAQATTALANAATAYTAATQSLQPSASTIVNSSYQMTAISTNGITVYSGSSATTGARVVMNSAGIAGYNSGGTATFAINASTGAASFSGSITGSAITGSSLNIGGNFTVDGTTGLLTATGATITGTINATAGYFGTSSNGWSIGSSGITGVGTATITGGQINGSSINIGSGTFQVDSSGNLNASSATITGKITSTSGSIGGFNLSSTGLSNSGSSIYINASTATVYGTTVNAGSGGITSANTITSTGTLTANAGFSLASGISGYGFNSQCAPGTDNSYYCGLSSWRWKAVYAVNGTIQTSDSRLKTNTQDSALGLDFINSLRPVSYKWIEGGKQVVTDDQGNPVKNEDGTIKTISISGKRTHWGFLAQEVKTAVDKSGVEDFAGWVLDDLNDPNSEQAVNYQQFIAPMVKAIQELSAEVEKLKGAANGTGTSTTN